MMNEAQIVEHARSFLRKNDFLGGYYPQLLLNEKESEIWSLFWFTTRMMDDIFDSKTTSKDVEKSDSLTDVLYNLTRTKPELKMAISIFTENSDGIFDFQSLAMLLASAKSEKKLFGKDRSNSMVAYFNLIDAKTKLPLQFYAELGRTSKDNPHFDLFLTWMARSVQLFDDLLDFYSDVEHGKNYITSEEMNFLQCETQQDLLFQINAMQSLRLAIFLHYSVDAYKLSSLFWKEPIGWFGRSILEACWSMIADSRAAPLPTGLLNNDYFLRHYVGLTSLPMDMLGTSEKTKYSIFNPVITHYIKSYKLFDFNQVEDLKDRLYKESYHAVIKSLPQSDISEDVETQFQKAIHLDARKWYDPNQNFGMNLFNWEELRNIGLNYFRGNRSQTQTVRKFTGRRNFHTRIIRI
ncbi:MAG: hypothetical protein AAGA77_19065 [Bacteroidota bacterium]